VLRVGQKVIYNPTFGNITRVWSAYEFYSFYPGMEMIIKGKKLLDTGFEVVTVDEVKEGWFGPSELIEPSLISESRRVEIINEFKKMWQKEKFKFFLFRKGQKVVFKPSNLTKLWNRNNVDFMRLIDNNIYNITKILDRKYVYLGDIPVKIYWKDLESRESGGIRGRVPNSSLAEALAAVAGW
jgi:hypothetical protein